METLQQSAIKGGLTVTTLGSLVNNWFVAACKGAPQWQTGQRLRGLPLLLIPVNHQDAHPPEKRAVSPPAPTICGTPNGPPVTATRVQLRDGRFLAYKEIGVEKKDAKYKIVAAHGYGFSRHAMVRGLSEELLLELQIYMVGYDRAGYGQSTPDPQRTVKSDAYDVQDLADALELGSTFYVAATSMGGSTGHGLMKYLPHRLAGLAMIAPVTNPWWTGLDPATVTATFDKKPIGDRLALRVAHYAPWLVYWYMTQTVFPTASIVKKATSKDKDLQLISKYYNTIHAGNLLEPIQQGRDASTFRDMRVAFGTWEFEPFELENPFATRNGSVHIWQGDKDVLVRVELRRQVARALPWVHYHEISEAGHGLLGIPGLADEVIRTLLQ